uniref:Uncharacterized protein n=1 Tax=Arundo donax TaxID=35708 RepID=A0A0A9CAG6_ARUDO
MLMSPLLSHIERKILLILDTINLQFTGPDQNQARIIWNS